MAKNSEPTRHLSKKRPLMMALEPRMMFDGAAVHAAHLDFDAAAKGAMHASPQLAQAALFAHLLPQESALDAGRGAELIRAARAPLYKALDASSFVANTANAAQIEPSDKALSSRQGVQTSHAGPAPGKAQAPVEVVFVENDVADYQGLIAGLHLPANAQVYVLDSTQDGLAQMAQILAGRNDISAIQIFSHGAEGELGLGSLVLTSQNLASHSAALSTIAGALGPNADVMLYGCDVAAGSAGAAFVNALSQSTHAVVAASTTAVGAASLGGSWDLDYSTGKLDVSKLVDTSYADLLGANQAINLYNNTTVYVQPGGTSNTFTFVTGWSGSGTGNSSVTEVALVNNESTYPPGTFYYSTNGGSTWNAYTVGTPGSFSYVAGGSGTLWKFVSSQSSTATTSGTIDVAYMVSGFGSEIGTQITLTDAPAPTGITASPGSGTYGSTSYIFDNAPSGSAIATLTATEAVVLPGGAWTITSQSVANLFTVTGSSTDNTATLSLGSGTLPADGTTVTVTVQYNDPFQTDSTGQPTGSAFVTKTLTFTVIGNSSTDLTGFGSNVNVSTYASGGQQYNPVSTVLSTGDVAVVWISPNQAGSGSDGLYGQILSPTGTPVGSEFTIDASAGAGTYDATPVVTALSGGQFVVAYENESGSAAEIAYRIVSTSGSVSVGSQQFADASQVSGAGSAQANPSIATMSDGTFVISWSASTDGSEASFQQYAQKFTSGGTASGSLVTLDSSTSDYDYYSAVVPLASGNYAVAWVDENTSNIYEAKVTSGTAGTVVTVGTGSDGDNYDDPIEATALTGGSYVVTWDNSTDVLFQMFTSSGVASGSIVTVDGSASSGSLVGNSTYPVIAPLSGGDFIIEWQVNSSASVVGDYNQGGVFGARFTSSGTAVDTTDFEVNGLREGNQIVGSVVGLSSNGFMSVWSDTGGIVGRVYTSPVPPTVSSIDITGSTPTNGASESFTVTYSEAMNPSSILNTDFSAHVVSGSLTDTGIAITEVSTSVYTVTVEGVSGNGVLRLDLNSGTSEQSGAGLTITAGHTGDQTYTVDQTAPTVSSVVTTGSAVNNGGSETFQVTFSEAVQGVSTSSFTAALTGSVTDTSISAVSGSGTTYDVTVAGVAGVGTLGLDVKSSGSGVSDLAGNALSGGFTTGSTYSVSTTKPTVSSITAVNALTNNGSTEQFTVTFSEAVTGVTASDFTIGLVNSTMTGATAISDAGITAISGSGTTYTVTVGSVQGDGSMQLDFKANSTGVTDIYGNGATAAFTSGATYTIEHTPPAVISSVANGALTNNGSSESFTVTFAESVTGVTASDFTLTTTNTLGGTALTTGGIASITGSGTTYVVTVGSVAGDGTLRLDLNANSTGITDAAGNGATAAFTGGDTYTIEHTPPSVSSVGVPSSGTYIAGQNLDFTVNFSEAVTVTGFPEIGITLTTGGTVYAQYLSGSGTSALTFRYVVIGGEMDMTGVTLDSAITINGGSIQDAATNAAVLTLNDVADTSGVLVDSIPPEVTSVSVPSDNTYGAGEVLTFTVNFSENVLVTTSGGTPYLPVTIGSSTVDATYAGGSGSSALTFSVTVVDGESAPSGISLGSAIVLGGGTIKDAATNAAVLALADVAPTTSVLVDAIPPTVTSIDITGTNPTNSSTDQFTVTFSTPVTGVDATDFTVVGTGTTSGNVTSVSGSGTTWTVTVGSVGGDGTLRLDLNNVGDPITDAYGNVLAAAHTGDQSYTVETTPPAVTSVTVPSDGTYVSGQDLDFTATFSEAVTVSGTPRIAITLTTGGTVYADYVSGSGSDVLTFRYTVVAGNQDLTGITTGAAIDLNGGTITDAATNAAGGSGLDLTGEASTANIDVDAIVPAVSSVLVPSDSTYGTGSDLDFTINFTKAVTVDTTGGTPYIVVDIGGTNVDATYLSGSGTTALVFQYAVPSGELAPSGISVGSSIVMGGGTIKDSIGNLADTTLTDVGSTTGVDVDSILPTVTSIVSGSTNPNNAASDTFTVTFSTAVTGVNAGDFGLTTANTPGGNALTTGGITSITTTDNIHYTVTVGSVAGDGTLRLDLNSGDSGITDAYGNSASASFTGGDVVTIEHTPPSATGMTVPGDGTYGVGQDMDFTVTFSEAVTVSTTGGTPRIAITLDTGGTVYATYLSGSGTSTLTFRYVPTAGVQDLTGIVTGTAIDANSGTIQDAAGNAAALAINAVEPSTAGVDVDAILPAVTSVGVPANATYIAGQDLDFTVNFNKNVTVDTTGGTPYITLTLATGGTVDAFYVSGSGTSSLVFEYVVAANEGAPGGVVVGSSLNLNSGTIDDVHGNPASLALSDVGSTAGVLVDSIPPIVDSITPGGATLTNAASVTYTVTFSEAVTGVVAGDFTLTTTGATSGTIASVTEVSASVYTVTVNNITGDGTMRLDLNGSGTGIADLATNAIAGGFTGGGLYTFDHEGASLTGVTVPAAGTYTTGQDLDFTVTFSEPVLVGTGGGTPRIAITLGNGEVVYADYVSGTGSTTLTFEYVVAQGDFDSAGIVVGGSVDLNGGCIFVAIGNSAGLVLANVGDTSHVLVDGTDPAVSGIATSGSTTGDTLTYTVTFNEAVTGVNAGDFTLTETGSAAGSIGSVTPVGSDGTTYTVTVNNVSGAGSLRLDLSASSAVTDLDGVKVAGYTGGQAVAVDRVPTTVTGVTVPAAGDYMPGQTLEFDVTFSQAVTVNTANGVPTIVITLDSGTVQAHYVSGSGSNTLVFTYTIVAGDKDAHGIAVAGAISENGGVIANAGSPGTSLNLVDVGSTSGVDIGVIAPPSPPPPTPPGGEPGRGFPPSPPTPPGQPGFGFVPPYVWVPLPIYEHNGPVPYWPATAELNWAPTPLLTLGQEANDFIFGQAGFSDPAQSPIGWFVNSLPFDMQWNDQVDLDVWRDLKWVAPPELQQSDADGAALVSVIPIRPGVTHNVEQQVDKKGDQQQKPVDVAHRTHAVRPVEHAPHQLAPQAAPHNGKASLSQQFSRYGKQAWEREQAALLDNARQAAERRAG